MAESGDMSLRAPRWGGFGTTARIDAHSLHSGDFTTPANFQGHGTVYVTPGGAAALAQLRENGSRVVVRRDWDGIAGAVRGFVAKGYEAVGILAPETHQGRPK